MQKKLIFSLLLALLIVLVPFSAFAEPETEGEPSTKTTEEPAETDAGSKEFEVIKVESSGPEVSLIQMRLRDLGFLNYRPTASFGSMTRTGVIGFQGRNGLSADGDVGEKTYSKLFNKVLFRATLSTSIKVPNGLKDNKKAKKYGATDDWFSVVSTVFRNGTTAKITDFNSGVTFNMQRVGGSNHAEVEVVTKADNTNFMKIFGKAYTFEKRTVLVTIGEKTYAGSLFGWPHGEDTISGNDMTGHTCLYFTGSFSHIFGFRDTEHDAMVNRAAAK